MSPTKTPSEPDRHSSILLDPPRPSLLIRSRIVRGHVSILHRFGTRRARRRRARPPGGGRSCWANPMPRPSDHAAVETSRPHVGAEKSGRSMRSRSSGDWECFEADPECETKGQQTNHPNVASGSCYTIRLDRTEGGQWMLKKKTQLRGCKHRIPLLQNASAILLLLPQRQRKNITFHGKGNGFMDSCPTRTIPIQAPKLVLFAQPPTHRSAPRREVVENPLRPSARVPRNKRPNRCLNTGLGDRHNIW